MVRRDRKVFGIDESVANNCLSKLTGIIILLSRFADPHESR